MVWMMAAAAMTELATDMNATPPVVTRFISSVARGEPPALGDLALAFDDELKGRLAAHADCKLREVTKALRPNSTLIVWDCPVGGEHVSMGTLLTITHNQLSSIEIMELERQARFSRGEHN
jgi:hypothetical protein